MGIETVVTMIMGVREGAGWAAPAGNTQRTQHGSLTASAARPKTRRALAIRGAMAKGFRTMGRSGGGRAAGEGSE